MSELTALDQGNWSALATLIIQLAFLVAAVWFARNILKAMRAFQEQIGALLKVSITGAAADQNSSTASANHGFAEQSPYWLPHSETNLAAHTEPVAISPSRITVARRSMLLWLQAPMSSTHGASWRRIVTWLQAPAGS